ncbi:MAG TPA: hypothetical protein VHE30_24740 [Polyangiaceae bacterium]|nr:hypothetical protein [Polyangiaceae bacterium]
MQRSADMALASRERAVHAEEPAPESGARPGKGMRQGRFKHVAVLTAVVLASGAAFALWVSNVTEETRAVQHLPPAERRALYERTLRTLEGPCRPGDDSRGLRAFCVEQANFIQKFPECGASCRSIAREYLRTPAK